MFDDITEKEDLDDIVGPNHPINGRKVPSGPGPRVIGNIKSIKTLAGIPHNRPCSITDCKYYDEWTVNHVVDPGNSNPCANVPLPGSGTPGTIVVKGPNNPLWCVCCRQFKGVEVGRVK